MGRDDSDEENDIVVMQACATKGCVNIEGLEFDVETNESYCAECRELFARAERDGFRVLLGPDDLALVKLIFDAYDKGHRGLWTHSEWADFAAVTGHGDETPPASAEELTALFAEEYDLTLEGGCVRLRDLENMYGGYKYNKVDALTEDCEALESEGVLSSAVLE